MFTAKGGLIMPQNDGNDRQMRAAYPAEPQRPVAYRARQDAYSGSGPAYEEGEINPGWAAGGAPRRQRHTAFWALVAFSCFSLLCLMGYFISSLYQAYRPFRQKAAIVGQNTFAQGVLVDNVHIGGMSRAQAAEALKSSAAAGGGLWLTVQVDGQTWVITPDELPLERNIQSVLDTAYAVGRQGSVETIASSVTPFEYRYAYLYHTVTAPVNLYTDVTYSGEKLWELVRVIENRVNREAVDAQVATFDFSTRAFTFTQDQQGARLDAEALYRSIAAELDRKNYTGTVTASTQPIMPKVTKAELMSSFSLISTYTTQTTSDANRNNNISLAAAAVNGTAVMPGETFSFNRATGQRTLEKGYLPAAAIAGGATVDEVGGGVCQVSSTLFNAAAMADMTILARSPHTWPSNYVEKGRDATVNWPNLDFSFRNDKAAPIFIVAWYRQRQCTVEIYGAALGPGVSIDLTTQLTAVYDPPAEPIYENNPLLEPGSTQEKKKARTGYVVETYKIYRQNGAETRREWLCTSNYPMIQQVIEYN